MRLSSAEGCNCLGAGSESLNAVIWLTSGAASQSALAASSFELLLKNADDIETSLGSVLISRLATAMGPVMALLGTEIVLCRAGCPTGIGCPSVVNT